MTKITEKENFMLYMTGQHPHWVPRYDMGPNPYSKYPSAISMASPSFLRGNRTPEGGFDIFGVEYVVSAETSGAAIPKPNDFILDDITKWRDIIKVPDISNIDWETMAKKDMASINRETTAVTLSIHVGYFQTLMAFMGFSEGLCAMFEEPDEVMELYSYLSDFYVKVIDKAMQYYKPDIFGLTDDTATARDPFVSLDMFKTMLMPFYREQTKAAVNAGIPVMVHNCGRCEDHIEDWFELGITAWNPAQMMNDLDGIKEKYGMKLGLCGCWDSAGPVNWPSATEELIRTKCRETIDRFAPGGGFCFWGSTYGPIGDQTVENRKRWLTEEYEDYGRSFYEKMG